MSRDGSQRKRETLREQGALHAHPDRVVDPLFEDGGFFDPEDVVQVKYEMLRRVRVEHACIAEVAEQFGLSRPTFYKAQADFARAGLTGLLPGKRGPRGAHKITPAVLHFIERVQAEEEGLDAQALAERIAQHFGHSVHRRTVERALARGKKKR